MKIQTLRDAEKALQPYIPMVSQLTGKDTTLDRIGPLMSMLGNPHHRLRTIHVAGTSGKTSTCYYIAALLESTGKRVGLTVSPHVDSISERIQINTTPISETDFCSYLSEFLPLVEQSPVAPSYFELLYAFAIWVLDRERVDYLVVETGVGGLFDATNIAQNADKVCVITDIGYDHQSILGHTLSEIASQKAGILHAGNQAFMYEQSPEVMKAVHERAAAVGAIVHTIREADTAPQLPLPEQMPAFQKRNWLLAHRAFRYVAQRDSLPVDNTQAISATQSLQIPGRMEVTHIGGKTLIMDGAHNQQKMAAFVNSFRQRHPGQKATVMAAFKTGKDYEAALSILAPITNTLIATSFNTSQDLPAVATDPALVASHAASAGITTVIIEPDHTAAYDKLLRSHDHICIVTGSFYLLGQLRNERTSQY